VYCRPPPAPAAGAFSVAAEPAAAANERGAAVEIPAIVEQAPTSTATDAAVTTAGSTSTTAGGSGLPTLDVQTNPELPSPARVRWMDAFSRVCAHINQVLVVSITVPSPPHSFIPRLKPSFLQILPTVAFLFFFGTDCTDSPDCLPILLSISVLLFSFSVFFTYSQLSSAR